MSVQPQLSLIPVSVEEPGMIHATTRVFVTGVIAQCRVELEGEPVRTANVYTENLNSTETTNIYRRYNIFYQPFLLYIDRR